MEVLLIPTFATLLSGQFLGECTHGTDPKCLVGVAHVDAFRRNATENGKIPSLVFPQLDTKSPFVSMHPLGWNVNRVVLEKIIGWDVFGSSSVLLQTSDGFNFSPRDLSGLQSTEFPFLLSNLDVSVSSSWFPYHEVIHFDEATHVALMSFVNTASTFNAPPIPLAKTLLDRVARLNMESGCLPASNTSTLVQLDVYAQQFASDSEGDRDSEPSSPHCWTPYILLRDTSAAMLQFIEEITKYENAPAVITIGSDQPDTIVSQYSVPTQKGPHRTWVHWFVVSSVNYVEYKLVFAGDKRSVRNLHVRRIPLWELPLSYRDDVYAAQIERLARLQSEALDQDPILGYTTEVRPPRIRHNTRTFQRCEAGECEVGNLFADAFRWRAEADVAFVSSGVFRGRGWSAGPVHVSNVWDTTSSANTLCTGVMSGISLFRVFNYSTAVATFHLDSTDDFKDNGGRLLQVSGLRVVYNTDLTGSRLTRLEIWNKDSESYENVERLRLYTVATNSYVCKVFEPFSHMLTNQLTIEGEKPFTVSDLGQQDTVADFLTRSTAEDEPHDVSVGERLVNDTTTLVALNFVQTERSCRVGTAWIESRQTCQACPDTSSVRFYRERVDVQPLSRSNDVIVSELSLLNGAPFPVIVTPKLSPSWFTIFETAKDEFRFDGRVTEARNSTSSVKLGTGDRLHLKFFLSSQNLEPGIVIGTVSYTVQDGGDFPGCEGSDAFFEIHMNVMPQDALNHIGSVRWVGWGLSGFITVSCFCCIWLAIAKRRLQVIRTLQPVFLITICVGVQTLALTLIPLGLDDEIVSEEVMDGMCLITPWLFSLGFSVILSAAFSKLWRINRLFKRQHMMRIDVRGDDILLTFLAALCPTLIVLVVWSFADPLHWVRTSVEGEEWNTYGRCDCESLLGKLCLAILVATHFVAYIITCWQCYRARVLIGQREQVKSIGLALFVWTQFAIVLIPLYYITEEENVRAKFFLLCSLVMVVTVATLIFTFAPAVTNLFPQIMTNTPSTTRTSTDPRSLLIRGSDPTHLGQGEEPAESWTSAVSSFEGSPLAREVKLTRLDSIEEADEEELTTSDEFSLTPSGGRIRDSDSEYEDAEEEDRLHANINKAVSKLTRTNVRFESVDDEEHQRPVELDDPTSGIETGNGVSSGHVEHRREDVPEEFIQEALETTAVSRDDESDVNEIIFQKI